MSASAYTNRWAIRASVNPRIPTYWFWLTAVFGVICLMPVPYKSFMGSGSHILATVYDRTPESWTSILLMHTSVAITIAMFVTVIHHFREKTKVVSRHGVRTTLTVRALLLATALAAITFALLRAAGAHTVVIICVLLAMAGQPVTAFLVGFLDRSDDQRGRPTAHAR